MFIDDTPVLGRRDDATVVDDHLSLIRKRVRDFIKKHGEGCSFDELMPVAYEAARQAWETSDPSKGFVFATHVRKRIRYALIDYVGDRNRIVKDVELLPERYASAWGDPDAKKKKPSRNRRPDIVESYDEKDKDGNKNKVTRYEPGPYRSSAQLIRGLGAVTSRHSKVTVVPTRTQFDDGWNKTCDGTSRKSVRIEDDRNPGVTDPHHVLWAGDKELKGKPKPGPADCADWKRIWAANYKKYRCGLEYQIRPWERAVEVTHAALEATGASYDRNDGVKMIAVKHDKWVLYISRHYHEGRPAPAETTRRKYAPTGPPPGLNDVWQKCNLPIRPSLPAASFIQARGYDGKIKIYLRAVPRHKVALPKVDPSRWDYIPGVRNPVMEKVEDYWVEFAQPAIATFVAKSWTPGNRQWFLKGSQMDPALPLVIFLPKARVAFDKGRLERKRIVELAEDAKRLRKRELRAAAEENAAWKWPTPQQLAELRAERPTWWSDAEIKNRADHWVTVPSGNNISTTVSKNSLLGRYKKQKEKVSTTAPRPPVLAPALLDGSHSDRRATSIVAQSQLVEEILELEILGPNNEADAPTTTLSHWSDKLWMRCLSI